MLISKLLRKTCKKLLNKKLQTRKVSKFGVSTLLPQICGSKLGWEDGERLEGGQAKHRCVQTDTGRVTRQQFPWTWNTISWRFDMGRPCCETIPLISVQGFCADREDAKVTYSTYSCEAGWSHTASVLNFMSHTWISHWYFHSYQYPTLCGGVLPPRVFGQ